MTVRELLGGYEEVKRGAGFPKLNFCNNGWAGCVVYMQFHTHTHIHYTPWDRGGGGRCAKALYPTGKNIKNSAQGKHIKHEQLNTL